MQLVDCSVNRGKARFVVIVYLDSCCLQMSSELQESLMSCRDQKNKSLSADQLIGVLDKLFGDSGDQSEALLCIYKDPHKVKGFIRGCYYIV